MAAPASDGGGQEASGHQVEALFSPDGFRAHWSDVLLRNVHGATDADALGLIATIIVERSSGTPLEKCSNGSCSRCYTCAIKP